MLTAPGPGVSACDFSLEWKCAHAACYPVSHMELSAQQVAVLDRLRSHGMDIVAFPMYESLVGVKRGNCAALLSPSEDGSFRLYGSPTYLISGQLSAHTIQSDGHWFVRKNEKIEATPERRAELDSFAADLAEILLPVA
jgi:hypothetical protein